tara:strand:- start:4365 stop:5255 length:891 start_codon:yes stop_codon:yes gene_type:complete
MKFLIFAITYPIIWMLSLLPMRILYILSDFFYLIFFHIIGYRKKVVLDNLQLAFPKKKLSELKLIQKKFFKHFTDLFVESIKAFTIRKKTLIKRYKYTNPELINELYDKGRSIAFMGAHQANWEWSISIPLFVKIKCFGAYTKIGNKYFDKSVKNSRTKFGFIGYKTTETVKSIARNFEEGTQGLYLLLSDQSPQVHKTYYWQKFMGVKVPIHTGAEMIAKKFDMAVVNYTVKKVKRGFFEVTFETITEHPREHKENEITDKYLTITERNICDQPEYYLWSHRRFKHKDKVPDIWK